VLDGVIGLTLFREEVLRVGFIFLNNAGGGRADGLACLVAAQVV
jgi:hypothetical protein